MPTYQRESMIPSALRTLLDQTCRDYECVIVDDGSTDGTERVLKDMKLDGRFRYYKLDHIGNMACRNYAIEQSRGEWITYLDSDDFWVPERLRLFKDKIEERPGVGFWFSNGFTYRYGRILETIFDSGTDIPEGNIPGHYAVGTEFLPYITTNIAIRRSLFKEYGLYRKDMIILDNELYARMFDGGVEVGVLRDPLAVRRIHDAQVTHLWVEEYPEALEALKAGNPSPEVLEEERLKLVDEVTGYLFKSLQPEKARAFLIEKLGDKASANRWYKYTFLPEGVLRTLKALRKRYIKVKYHPVLASEKAKRAQAYVQPLIDKEK